MGLAQVIADVSYGGKSVDPSADENSTIDFQDGFAVGYEQCVQDDIASHPITVEYTRRGFTDQVDASFKEWKRGYWAGCFTRIEDNMHKSEDTN